MKKENKKYLKVSILICLISAVLIPSGYSDEGIGSYYYGYPFTFVQIYQYEPTNPSFMINFFSGNDGMSVNVLSFILNMLLVNVCINFVMKRLSARMLN
ncbi:hypothetical protein LCM20_01650 [Halobacillus litoralis]|uniref:hypothetical protein n=1 Tax=Halobacillus litoralis TaxID=45668 RepID=UPI001CD20377|nr:hypothetical protein [Halobacillus litoralis]MCA0969291.1 hypothetical protein [Halobacillus litoralis]